MHSTESMVAPRTLGRSLSQARHPHPKKGRATASVENGPPDRYRYPYAACVRTRNDSRDQVRGRVRRKCPCENQRNTIDRSERRAKMKPYERTEKSTEKRFTLNWCFPIYYLIVAQCTKHIMLYRKQQNEKDLLGLHKTSFSKTLQSWIPAAAFL